VLAVALGQPDRLACSLTEEIQFCTPCLSASNRLDINNIRRMKREDSLYALVAYDAPHDEGFANPPALSGDYCTGKYLSPLLVAFFDSAVHIYHIAYFEMWYSLLQAFTFNCIQHFRFH